MYLRNAEPTLEQLLDDPIAHLLARDRLQPRGSTLSEYPRNRDRAAYADILSIILGMVRVSERT